MAADGEEYKDGKKVSAVVQTGVAWFETTALVWENEKKKAE